MSEPNAVPQEALSQPGRAASRSGPVALDIMELNPAFDLRNRTAELIVELVQSLFGEQILSRHGVDL